MREALASYSAEWLKMRKRPAVWVLGSILVALAALLQYGTVFLLIATLPKNASLAPTTLSALRQALHPTHWVQMTLGTFASGSFAGPVALILGVLAYGSEYGWSTLKTVFTQRPGRLATVAGKLTALAAVIAVFVVSVFAGTAAVTAVIGAADGALTPWPSAVDVAKGLLTGWLVLTMWAAFGVALSVLFRQSALAIGLGLIYAIVMEGVVLNLAAQLPFMRETLPYFPGWNATSLVRSFGTAFPTTQAALGRTPFVGGMQAAVVVAAFAAAFSALAAALLRRRDVM